MLPLISLREMSGTKTYKTNSEYSKIYRMISSHVCT